MRKAMMWVGGVAAVAVVGVGGGWFALKPTVENRLVALLDDARAHGVETRYETLTIGGFPFGYAAEFSDLFIENTRDGWSVLFPDATGAVSAFDPNAATFTMPKRFTMTMAQPVGDERILLRREVTSENLIVRLARAEGSAVDYEIDADRIRVAPADTDAEDHVEATAARIAGRLGGATTGSPDAIDMTFDAEQATARLAIDTGAGALQEMALTADAITSRSDLTEAGLDAEGAIGVVRLTAADAFSTVETVVEEVAVKLSATPAPDATPATDGAAIDRIAAMLLQAATGRGVADVSVATGPWRQLGSTAGEPGGAPQTVEVAGDGGETKMSMAGDRMTVSTNATGVAFAYDGAAPIRGGVGRMTAEASYPLRAQEGAIQDATLSYALRDATLGDETWDWLDPEAAMPRAMPGIEFAGTIGLEVLQDFFELREEAVTELGALTSDPTGDETAPFSVRSARLDTLTLDMMGLSADAIADVAFDESGAPTGTIDVTIANWRAFLESASRTRMGDPAMIAQAAFMLEQFARPVDETTSRIDVEFDKGTIIINGQEIGG